MDRKKKLVVAASGLSAIALHLSRAANMPKKKQAESSSDTSLNSSDDESKKPAKKQKTDSKKSSSKDDSEEKSWDLGGKKSVKLSNFRGRTFVDIREYYLDKNDGELKPGRKGIALGAEQWNKLKNYVEEIDKAFKDAT